MEKELRFYLQMGYGMKSMNLQLLKSFNNLKNTGVIIWPRTLNDSQIKRHAKELRRYGAAILYDSCFYLPRGTRMELYNLPYWSQTSFNTVEFTGKEGKDFCNRVIEYQTSLNVTEILLPGRFTDTVNEYWLEMHRQFAEIGHDFQLERPVYATIALGSDLICDQQSMDKVLNEVTAYPVNGIYFLCRKPKSEFISANAQLYFNLLTFFLSLSLAGKDIILGYANQSDLLYAAAGVRTIASGNYRNVRNFDPDIFNENEDDEVIKRKIWFYDGNTLCEFVKEQLGIAYQNLGMKGMFGPSSIYTDSLLKSDNPALERFQEPDAFKHYLTVIRNQWLAFQKFYPSERVDAVEDFF